MFHLPCEPPDDALGVFSNEELPRFIKAEIQSIMRMHNRRERIQEQTKSKCDWDKEMLNWNSTGFKNNLTGKSK